MMVAATHGDCTGATDTWCLGEISSVIRLGIPVEYPGLMSNGWLVGFGGFGLHVFLETAGLMTRIGRCSLIFK